MQEVLAKKTPCYNPFIKLSITRQSKITSWALATRALLRVLIMSAVWWF